MSWATLLIAISMLCVNIAEAKVSAVLKKVEAKYSKASAIRMDVKKTLVLSMLNRKNESTGFLAMSGKKNFRLEFSAPVKSIVIMNSKQIWAVDYPPEGVDDKIHVSLAKVDKKNQTQVNITSLLGKGRIQQQFSVTSEEKVAESENEVIVFLKPKKDSEEISKLSIRVNTKANEIVEVIWWDNLDNQTQMLLSKNDFKAKFPKGFFDYTPPKNSDVTDM